MNRFWESQALEISMGHESVWPLKQKGGFKRFDGYPFHPVSHINWPISHESSHDRKLNNGSDEFYWSGAGVGARERRQYWETPYSLHLERAGPGKSLG